MALAGSATRRALPKTELCPSPPVEWAAWDGSTSELADHGLIECATPTGCPWRRWCSTGLGSSPSRLATLRGHTWRAFWDWLTASIRRSSPRRRRHCPGFDSPSPPPPAAPLPTAVPAEDLQRHVRELTPEACEPPLATNQKSFIRLDEGLGQKVDAWCNEHGVDYAGYLRSILRLAAGFDSIDQLQPTHVQPQLDLDASQERPKAS